MPDGPKGRTDLVPIRIFPNQGYGYGFGVTSLGRDGPPEGYDRTIGMTVREGRVFSPSFAFTSQSTALFSSTRPSFLIYWDESLIIPIALVGYGSAVYIIKNGAITSEGDATSANYGNAVFWDDGAGTAYLYAATTSGNKYLNRRNYAASWGEDDDVVAVRIVEAAGALWRAVNNYQVSKCPAANNPFTVASWGAAIQVGTNNAAIVSAGAIDEKVIWGKTDGIWAYKEISDRYENIFPVPGHAGNFPVMVPDGGGGLYTPAANGDIIHIGRFGNIRALKPLRGKYAGRDTPRGPIRDIALWGDTLYALMDPAYHRVQPSGLAVIKTVNDFSSFTDYTTEATDKDYTSYVILDSLDTLANGDALLVGALDQFLAVTFFITAANANSVTLSVAISTGAGTWSSVTVWDGTQAGGPASADKTFGQLGTVALRPQDISSWAKATYDSKERYWLRFTVSGALDSEVEIAEVDIVPRRAAPPFSTTNNDQIEVWEASGMLPKIFALRIVGDRILWDDVYTLPTVAPAGLLTTTQFPTDNSPYALLAVNSDGYFLMPLPYLDVPSITPFPVLGRDASNQVVPVFYPSAVDLGGMHELVYVECQGDDFTDETDVWRLSFRLDETNEWTAEHIVASSDALFELSESENVVGRTLHTALMIVDGAITDPVGPTGRRITAWVKPRPDLDDQRLTQPTRTIPEAS